MTKAIILLAGLFALAACQPGGIYSSTSNPTAANPTAASSSGYQNSYQGSSDY